MKPENTTSAGRIFSDRIDAGEQLAKQLAAYHGRNPLVLAIPRGALPIGQVLAQRLQGELDVVLVHKLSLPYNPEYAIGAMDESGWTYLAPEYRSTQSGADDELEKLKAEQLAALQQRRRQYSPLTTPIDPRGRIVIIVDDGLATGATMIAALHAVRARQPAELVCAIPVAANSSLPVVAALADKVVCLRRPDHFGAVSQFYRSFPQVSDDEAAAILSAAAKRRRA